MQIDFARSARSTVGLEWELACVDQRTGELVPVAPEILRQLGPPTGSMPEITKEFLTNTVELISAPHPRVRDAVVDLETLVARTRAITDTLGADLMCSGTHPFSRWFQQEVTPGNDRYATLVDRTQWWGRQLMIWGVHMHVGVEDRAKVLPILNGLLTYYPHFQALSASSPYWAGDDTGYASTRAMMFQQIPTAGLPPQLGSWANLEQIVEDLAHIGVIEDHTELRWDVRPSPRWGTIELRFCDGLATAHEVGALAALAQCLVEEMSTSLDRGEVPPTMQPWYVRENKWRAARYGMEAIIIQNAAGDECLVQDDLLRLIERLAPTAERLGCLAELDGIRAVIERGASYQRQRRVAAENGGDLGAVVRALVGELRDGLA